VHGRSVAQTTIDDFAARHGSLEKDHVELRTLSANWTDELKASLDRSAAKIAELESILTDRDTEAKGLLEEIDALQAEVNLSRSERQQLSQAAASHVSVLSELDSHRATLSTVQQELLATKAELEALHVDRTRQEEAMRELQRRMSDYTTSPTTDPSEFLTDGKQRPLSINIGRSASPLGRRKPPPPTPPPNMPPPPLPLSFPAYGDAEGSASRPHSQVQTIRTNSISSTSGRRSPRSSSSIDGNAFPAPPPGPDPRLLAQLEDQRENVKNLNKRLQHCEADLQANIDLVNTLEAALNDSERALRKARLSANDIAKERDRASSECETLRSLLQHARAEVLSVKSSADNDSRQLEEKMASEMRQRENAKRELEERLEAMQSRKSKFNVRILCQAVYLIPSRSGADTISIHQCF
jgi:DNA repair exonuclease SbcCD ATPase subunit